jgi:hypothetical protein
MEFSAFNKTFLNISSYRYDYKKVPVTRDVNIYRRSLALCMALLLAISFSPSAFASDLEFDWTLSPRSVTIETEETFELSAAVRRVSGEGYVEIRVIPEQGLDTERTVIISEYLTGAVNASIPIRAAAFGGNYTLRVQALSGDDPSNLEEKEERTVHIVVLEQLRNHVRVSILPSTYSGFTPLTVTFTANVQGGIPPYTYAWRFGEGGSSTEKDPTYTFTKPGFYGVTLNMKDSRAMGWGDYVIITVYGESMQPPPRKNTVASSDSAERKGMPDSDSGVW